MRIVTPENNRFASVTSNGAGVVGLMPNGGLLSTACLETSGGMIVVAISQAAPRVSAGSAATDVTSVATGKGVTGYTFLAPTNAVVSVGETSTATPDLCRSRSVTDRTPITAPTRQPTR